MMPGSPRCCLTCSRRKRKRSTRTLASTDSTSVWTAPDVDCHSERSRGISDCKLKGSFAGSFDSAQDDTLLPSRVLRHLSIRTSFVIRHLRAASVAKRRRVLRHSSLYVTTLPHKLFVPQMPARKHSSCTIWL